MNVQCANHAVLLTVLGCGFHSIELWVISKFLNFMELLVLELKCNDPEKWLYFSSLQFWNCHQLPTFRTLLSVSQTKYFSLIIQSGMHANEHEHCTLNKSIIVKLRKILFGVFNITLFNVIITQSTFIKQNDDNLEFWILPLEAGVVVVWFMVIL